MGEGAGRMPSKFLGREATVKGSDKTFGQWLGANWMWLTIVGVMLFGVTGLGYKIFSTYVATFPYISNEHTAWASFGSLLAGFFTLTGTVATVATLLFLAHQNKAMHKVTQAQLDSMTFERYINHRNFFLNSCTKRFLSTKGRLDLKIPVIYIIRYLRRTILTIASFLCLLNMMLVATPSIVLEKC